MSIKDANQSPVAMSAMAAAMERAGVPADNPTVEAIRAAQSSAAMQHENNQLKANMEAMSQRLSATQEELATTAAAALQAEQEKAQLLAEKEQRLTYERAAFEAQKATATEEQKDDPVKPAAKPTVSKSNSVWQSVKSRPYTVLTAAVVVAGVATWWKFKK